MSKRAVGGPWLLLFIAVCLVAVNMRMSITGIGPLLEQIAADRGTTAAALGALASVPLIVWALISPFVHGIGERIGLERAVSWSLVVLMIGTAWRSLPIGSLSLWLGTAVIGAALAVGNVLIPALARRDFGARIPLVMGAYSALLNGFGALASGFVVPVSHIVAGGDELGWRTALLLTAAPVPIALIVWIIASRPAAQPDPLTPTGTAALPASRRPPPGSRVGRDIWRDPIAWRVAFYMGLQSLTFYVLSTWIAPVQASQGRTPVEAGLDVMIYQLAAIPGALCLPLLFRGPLRRFLAALIPAFIAVSFAGIVLLPGPNLLGLLVAGFAAGVSLGLALMLMAIRAREQETASALSGMAQSVGYLIAGAGPIMFGWLNELTGGWSLPLGFMLALLLIHVILGFSVSRDRYVFDRREAGER